MGRLEVVSERGMDVPEMTFEDLEYGEMFIFTDYKISPDMSGKPFARVGRTGFLLLEDISLGLWEAEGADQEFGSIMEFPVQPIEATLTWRIPQRAQHTIVEEIAVKTAP